jgi:hypothetical protein
MLIIGCDYHPDFQQIAFVDTDTGELSERRLAHREQVTVRSQPEWRRQQLGQYSAGRTKLAFVFPDEQAPSVPTQNVELC